MKKDEIKNSADLFLYKAHVDLRSAKYLLQGFEKNGLEIDIEKIYFELQQCAEKVLKSELSRRNILIQKTHDIEQLINLCKTHEIYLHDEIASLIELSDYAVDGRYSIIHDDINESGKYIQILEQIIER
jgi:HEPN domain-containing protein